jgi:hypothetical protein
MPISTRVAAVLTLLLVPPATAPADGPDPAKKPSFSSLSAEETAAFYRSASLLVAIAIDDLAAEDDPRVVRVREFLGRVDAKYREDAKAIVDATIRTLDRLHKGGHVHVDALTMFQILEGSLEWHPRFIPPPAHGWRFEEFCEQYALLREEKGMDHEKAKETLLAAERCFYGFAAGDQAKQRAFLKEAGIVPEDDFTTRAHKFGTHMRGLEDGSIPVAPQPDPVRTQADADAQVRAIYARKREEKLAEEQRLKAERALRIASNLEKSRKRDAAIKQYRQVIAEFPGSPQADEAAGRIKVLDGK